MNSDLLFDQKLTAQTTERPRRTKRCGAIILFFTRVIRAHGCELRRTKAPRRPVDTVFGERRDFLTRSCHDDDDDYKAVRRKMSRGTP